MIKKNNVEGLEDTFPMEAELDKRYPEEVVSNIMFYDDRVMTFGYVGRIALERFYGDMDGSFAGTIDGITSGRITCNKYNSKKEDGDSPTGIDARVKGEINGWFSGVIKIGLRPGDEEDSVVVQQAYGETYDYLQDAPLLWRGVDSVEGIEERTAAGLKSAGLETIGSVIEAYENGDTTSDVIAVINAIGYDSEDSE